VKANLLYVDVQVLEEENLDEGEGAHKTMMKEKVITCTMRKSTMTMKPII
jgi:hypothetical protein